MRSEAFDRFEPPYKIVSCDKVCEMNVHLFMVIAVIPLECSVHSLDLTFSPCMVGFGQPMLNPVRVKDHVKAHRSRICCVYVSGLLGELDAIVGEDGVDVIGNGFS